MTLAARLVTAFALVAAGVLCWRAAGVADDLAARHERRATLQEEAAPPSNLWRGLVARAVTAGIGGDAAGEAQIDYWTRRYDTLSGNTALDEDDPGGSLIAAHALFRKMEREGARTAGAERLDRVLQAYASVLKNGGFSHDAAYNYEFVSRLRDGVARGKAASPQRPPVSPSSSAARDDLPRGPTIHGRPGAHPPGSRGDEFDVLTPMDYGEREAQPEPTPGRKLPRKG